MTGSVSPLYEPAMLLGRAGVVPGHDLTTEAALTKLSYLLAQSELTQEDVTRLMSTDLCGELTEHARTTFQHPGDQLLPRQVKLSRLNYAIAGGELEHVRDFMQSDCKWLINEADYTGNSPMVSSADYSHAV